MQDIDLLAQRYLDHIAGAPRRTLPSQQRTNTLTNFKVVLLDGSSHLVQGLNAEVVKEFAAISHLSPVVKIEQF